MIQDELPMELKRSLRKLVESEVLTKPLHQACGIALLKLNAINEYLNANITVEDKSSLSDACFVNHNSEENKHGGVQRS